ncbi:dyf-18 [Pristionchus pacificus]|uniref:Dyf-18 n=1 Tax=Pristionchus pacificus TaxID=54126 RepID=A0A2A6BWQ9_PRIPA|nr:dyf-18 [Pristionchus pacificus]|eukprot:PDM70335.1 dyf-18 [Pristionchus pacificus]
MEPHECALTTGHFLPTFPGLTALHSSQSPPPCTGNVRGSASASPPHPESSWQARMARHGTRPAEHPEEGWTDPSLPERTVLPPIGGLKQRSAIVPRPAIDRLARTQSQPPTVSRRRFRTAVKPDEEIDRSSSSTYRITEPIGQGAFGFVVKATVLETGSTVAIKRVNLATRERAECELAILRACRHPNIVRFLDVCQSPSTMSIVMEFVQFNLTDLIAGLRRSSQEETIILFFFRQFLRALSYLHKNNVMHRDIKPSNILISYSNELKLCDFGQACVYQPEEKEKRYEEQVGTRSYRAPELLFSHLQYSPSIDWWSAGCLLGELINRRAVFQGRTDLEQIALVFASFGTPNARNWPEFKSYPDASKIMFDPIATPKQHIQALVPSCTCPALLSLLSSLLRLSPASRMAPGALLRHPAFSSLPRSLDYRIRRLVAGPASASDMLTLDSIFADMSL